MKKVLVTGALGQIGSELVVKLKNVYGEDNVIASGRRKKGPYDGLFELVDVTQPEQIFEVVKKHKVDWVIHLAALLSAVGENNPTAAWNINMGGLFNILEVAKQEGCGVFVPSSIAAFGPNTPKINTPQDTIQRPTTMYGVTKVAGEILCDYYYKRFGVDTRGVRFPGLISYETLPGGGTTDYAVHIYYEALKQKKFTCPLDKETHMDMMYMPDALNAIVNLMEADASKLIHRNAFNIASMSFCPEDICKSIQKFIPEFTMDYDINPTLQNIANSWPDSLDDSNARNEWGWNPEYDLDSMTKDMLEKLREKLDIK